MLLAAAQKGRREAVPLLLYRGGPPLADLADRHGRTPLLVAAEKDPEFAALLLHAGADLTRTAESGKRAHELRHAGSGDASAATKASASASSASSSSPSSAAAASIAQNVSSLHQQLLPEYEWRRDNEAAWQQLRAATAGDTATLRASLVEGATAVGAMAVDPRTRLTPLLAASAAGRIECVELLVQAGARTDETDTKGRNAISLATAFATSPFARPDVEGVAAAAVLQLLLFVELDGDNSAAFAASALLDASSSDSYFDNREHGQKSAAAVKPSPRTTRNSSRTRQSARASGVLSGTNAYLQSQEVASTVTDVVQRWKKRNEGRRTFLSRRKSFRNGLASAEKVLRAKHCLDDEATVWHAVISVPTFCSVVRAVVQEAPHLFNESWRDVSAPVCREAMVRRPRLFIVDSIHSFIITGDRLSAGGSSVFSEALQASQGATQLICVHADCSKRHEQQLERSGS